MWDWSLTTDRRPPPSPTPARCRVDPEGELTQLTISLETQHSQFGGPPAQFAALPAREPRKVGSTGLGRGQRVEGATCRYLLAGDGTFGTPATDELIVQCSNVVTRCLKPIRQSRWMTSQISQAMNPEKPNLPTLATAANREIVAILPLSTYLNGSCRSRPATRAAITLAACLPDCVATCATPGTPASIMSPATKTSGNPDSEQSSCTGTRPARSTCRPACLARCLANGEAATPAAHTLVRLSMRRGLPPAALMSMPYSSTSTTTAPSCTSTPSCSSFLVALAARCSPNVPSTIEAPSSSTTRACRGSMRR